MSQESELSGLPMALLASQSSLLTHASQFQSQNIFAQMSQFLLSLRQHQKFCNHQTSREEDEIDRPFDLSGKKMKLETI